MTIKQPRTLIPCPHFPDSDLGYGLGTLSCKQGDKVMWGAINHQDEHEDPIIRDPPREWDQQPG
jgi:hypothetical protein